MTEEEYKQIGERIRGLREKRGLSREWVAELANISSKFLYDIEVGNKSFSVEKLFGLAKSLRASADYIVYGEISYHTMDDIAVALQNLSLEKREMVITIFGMICRAVIE